MEQEPWQPEVEEEHIAWAEGVAESVPEQDTAEDTVGLRRPQVKSRGQLWVSNHFAMHRPLEKPCLQPQGKIRKI